MQMYFQHEAQGSGDSQHMKVVNYAALEKEAEGRDSESDNELLTSIWGKRRITTSNKEDDSDDDDKPSNKRKKNVKSEDKREKGVKPEKKDNKSKTVKAQPPKEPKKTTSALPMASPSKKANNEMDVAEQVLLQADQVIKKFGDTSSYMAMTGKAMDTLLAKFDTRLSVANLKLYTAELDGQENQRGRCTCFVSRHPSHPPMFETCCCF